jgi:undecaprenyl phosphate-alpha-L-ara4N flippase subunit ArnE
MTSAELSLCLLSVTGSSASQLLFKAASLQKMRHMFAIRFLSGIALQFFSIILAVLALRTLQLSQIIPFAAGSYLIIPLAGQVIFGERLRYVFWIGGLLIFCGIIAIKH